MRNIKEILDTCAAGIDFHATIDYKAAPEALLNYVSDAAIDRSHNRIHHLNSCIRQCEIIANTNLQTDTYRQLILNLLEHWDSLGTWTWPYRVLCDIVAMDEPCQHCSL